MTSTLFEFLVLAIAFGGGLALVGLPIRLWLLDEPGGRPSPVPVTLVGLAVLQLGAWYWLEIGGGSADGYGWVLLALGAVGSAVSIPRLWRAIRTDPRRHIAPVAAGVGAGLIFLLAFSSLFRVGYLTTASLGNNDAASYAVVGEHIADEGFRQRGEITGIDLGHLAREDAFGSTVLVGVAGDATGLGAWKLTMPALFVLVVVGAATLARLLAELFPGSEAGAAAAAVAALAGILPTYVIAQFFLGQIMAMAVAPVLVLLAIRARTADSWTTRVHLAGGVAVCVTVLLADYSQMLAPVVAVLVPGTLLLGRRGDWRRTVANTAVVLGAGAVAAAVIAPQWVRHAISQSARFSDVEAGWSLPAFLPVELVGLTSTVVPHGSGRVAASVIIVAVVLAAVAILVRRQRGAAWVGTAVALILLSHGAVYLREGGPTYRQWKWITFFQPVFAAGAIIVVGLALGRPLRRRLPWVAAAVPVVLALGVTVAAYREAGEQLGPPLRDDRPAAYVDPGLAQLEHHPALGGVASLDVDVKPYWDTMWVAYFLSGVDLHLLKPSYFPVSRPSSTWTVTERVGDLSGDPYAPLTDRFRLERAFTGPTSSRADGLDADIEVDSWSTDPVAGGAFVAHVVATNNGTAAWLPLGAGIGGVELGVHLATPTGEQLNHDFARQPLVAGWDRPIPPGGTVTFDVSVPAPPPGPHVLEFQLVSEGVAWFGEIEPLPTTTGAGAR